MGADRGDVPCTFDLAQCRYHGIGGLPKDKTKAYPLFLAAAREGLARAQNHVGIHHANGEGGVTEDLAVANEWFRKAADQGNARAQFNLACNLEQGRGLPSSNPQEAYFWYQRSARQDLALAKQALKRLNDPPL
eukprot:TRINITY_DN11170_c0_g1_i1.p1 TRINITY_DN11170_c0_g1~~TRINITY_DN11170_c0_g1_i1.p1  ORF type:complete len:134 (+),score=16.88 TRINITY_DN11170_c0_g1_i1:260-661(+)